MTHEEREKHARNRCAEKLETIAAQLRDGEYSALEVRWFGLLGRNGTLGFRAAAAPVFDDSDNHEPA